MTVGISVKKWSKIYHCVLDLSTLMYYSKNWCLLIIFGRYLVVEDVLLIAATVLSIRSTSFEDEIRKRFYSYANLSWAIESFISSSCRKLHDQCILPSTMYGSETKNTMKAMGRGIAASQRKMMRSMLGIKFEESKVYRKTNGGQSVQENKWWKKCTRKQMVNKVYRKTNDGQSVQENKWWTKCTRKQMVDKVYRKTNGGQSV